MVKITLGNFFKLSQDLSSRKLTGHAARDKILEIMNKSSKDEWNFFYKESYKRYEMWFIRKNNQ